MLHSLDTFLTIYVLLNIMVDRIGLIYVYMDYCSLYNFLTSSNQTVRSHLLIGQGSLRQLYKNHKVSEKILDTNLWKFCKLIYKRNA